MHAEDTAHLCHGHRVDGVAYNSSLNDATLADGDGRGSHARPATVHCLFQARPGVAEVAHQFEQLQIGVQFAAAQHSHSASAFATA